MTGKTGMRDNSGTMSVRSLYVLGMVLVAFAARTVFDLVGGDEIAWGLNIAHSLAVGVGAALFMFAFARRR